MTPTFKAHIAEQNYTAVRLGCILCGVLLPAGLILDLTTVSREHHGYFLFLRLAASGVAFALFLISRLAFVKDYTYHLLVFLSLVCSGAIELMIIRLDTAGSPYYAGLNLIVLGFGLICVWSGRQTALAWFLILSMWLVPALLTKQTPEMRKHFFNNLYFLALTGVIAVAGNATRYNLTRREWEARTALTRTSAELQTTLERVRELDRLKSQFFSNISHELRTPLTLITAPLQDLLGKDNPGQVPRATLQVILRNALRLHRLIDGLLDLARLEEGRLRLRISPLDVKGVVRGVVAAFQPAAESMGIKLSLDIRLSGDGFVLGDGDKLEVVITNLLGNAVKFTDRGGAVQVRLHDQPDGIILSVEDTGSGIPEADQPHVFERFRRVESPDRKQGGAGIGLALVKELVELHGGKVHLRSRQGVGTMLTVYLPNKGTVHQDGKIPDSRPGIAQASSEKTPVHVYLNESIESNRTREILKLSSESWETPPPPSGKPYVLVAEDNADLRRFLRELLAEHYRVEAYSDGNAALEAILKTLPDLIISDIMMPHLSGLELCEKVKGDPRTRGIPVLLLTARGGIDETLEGFGHGADDYLVKPFNPRELLTRVGVQLKLRRLSAQVANTARLAAMGTLAAGVAHEIKNPLNAIKTGISAMKRRGPDLGESQGEILDIMDECVSRIADIASALTDHARPADGEGLSLCDVRQGLESTLRLLGDRLRAAGVEVVRSYHSEKRITCRPGQINQVLMNLLDNALRASTKGGQIFLTLVDSQMEPGGEAITLYVRDQGSGIPLEDHERIFDPFFTTRPPGEGTGLGLYLSRQIVSAHGGELRVSRNSLSGTEFSLTLPVAPLAPYNQSGPVN